MTDKTRRFCIMLYPKEDPTHENAMNFIIKHFTKWASIVHDKDVDTETGELIKEHTHIVVEFPNPRHITGVAKELSIGANYIQECRNFENALSYLIHFNEETKYQYDIDEVSGPLKATLIRKINSFGKDENEKSNDLLDIIAQWHGKVSLQEFNRKVNEQGLFSDFRRAWGWYKSLIDEHNNKFQSDYNQ